MHNAVRLKHECYNAVLLLSIPVATAALLGICQQRHSFSSVAHVLSAAATAITTRIQRYLQYGLHSVDCSNHAAALCYSSVRHKRCSNCLCCLSFSNSSATAAPPLAAAATAAAAAAAGAAPILPTKALPYCSTPA
jgi:hypothetical protein